MKKYLLNLTLVQKDIPQKDYVLLKLTDTQRPLPEMLPGQFVEIQVASPNSFLRCPISVNWVDVSANELWLLIHVVGDATRAIATTQIGATLNLILPLGNGFTLPKTEDAKALLVGGGVGVAPMLFLGAKLKALGICPTFLLGARTQADLLQLDDFSKIGEVLTTTEDGSHGERGFVTQHSVWQQRSFTHVYSCGPKPMMKAVAKLALEHGYECEVSLENMMACGLGACLCCVEDTQEGHLCVCKDGPVFNVKRLKWF